MVGEIRLTDCEQAGDGRHQVVIDPKAAHGVVSRGIDPHRDVVRVLSGDPLIHVEQVSVTLADSLFA